VDTGWVGVITGDDWVDFEGNQEAASARTVKHLARITGKPVGRPEDQSVERLTAGRACPHCGRPAPQGRARCLYCGKDLTSGDPRDAWLEP